MKKRIFFSQIQSSYNHKHKNYIIYDIQSESFRFHKIMSLQFKDLRLLIQSCLFQRQKQCLSNYNTPYLENDQFIIQNEGSQSIIVTKYIPSLSLQERQKQFTCNLQPNPHIFDFTFLSKTIFRMLMKGPKHLIPTFQNVLIDKNQNIYLNQSSTVGWELLLLDQQVSDIQFRQICLFLDLRIFERVAEKRINFRVKQRSLAILLLSFVAEEIFNLPNRLKLPKIVNKGTAIAALQQLDHLLHKFLQIAKIKHKIEMKEKEYNVSLALFLDKILICDRINKEQSCQVQLNWCQILRILYLKKTETSQLHYFIQDLAKNTWNTLSEQAHSYYAQNALIPIKQRNSLWCHQQTETFFLVHLNQNLQKGFLADRLLRKELNKDSFTLNSKIQRLLASSKEEIFRLQRPFVSRSQGRLLIYGETDKNCLNCLVLAQLNLQKEIAVGQSDKKDTKVVGTHQRLQSLWKYARAIQYDSKQTLQK